MRLGRTAKGGVDALNEFGRAEEAIGFDDAALAVDPLGLDGIEPGRLDGELADEEANPLALPLDLAVVRVEPGRDRLAEVPGGIVPDEEQGRLTALGQLPTTPVEELDRDGTDGPSVHEAQPEVLLLAEWVLWGRGGGAQQKPIAGQGFGVGIVFGDRLLGEVQRLVRGRPAVQGRLGQATPPGLVQKPERPTRMLLGEPDQPVAPPFFAAYSGSGLVIQPLARVQSSPTRWRVVRIVSPLTRRRWVIPSATLTSASSASVQTLVA
jgi:hypothetical protein